MLRGRSTGRRRLTSPDYWPRLCSKQARPSDDARGALRGTLSPRDASAARSSAAAICPTPDFVENPGRVSNC